MNTIVAHQSVCFPRENVGIQNVFAAQGNAVLRLRHSTAAERISRIRKFVAALLVNREAVIAACMADSGKMAVEVEQAEIMPVIAVADEAIRNLSRWMQSGSGSALPKTPVAASDTRYDAKGRVLMIAPWAYPLRLSLNMTLTPLISALAAGNAVMIKPSEMTPHASAAIGVVVREAFSEDEVAVFEGDVTVSQTLLELPFDHVFFTGSTALGSVPTPALSGPGFTRSSARPLPGIGSVDGAGRCISPGAQAYHFFLEFSRECEGAPDQLMLGRMYFTPFKDLAISFVQALFRKLLRVEISDHSVYLKEVSAR